MRHRTTNVLGLTTEILTWASSGTIAGTIACTMRDRNETLVSSTAGVSSGNGLYYANVTMPGTPGWYVNEWIAVVNANTFASRQFFKVVKMEVD